MKNKWQHHVSNKIAQQIQKDLPEIVDDYRNGMFVREIVSNYEIEAIYGLSESTARTVVRYAITGQVLEDMILLDLSQIVMKEKNWENAQ